MRIFNPHGNRHLHQFVEAMNDWKSVYIFKPVFVSILPIVMAFYGTQPIHDRLASLAPSLTKFLDGNILNVCITASGLLFLMTILYGYISNKISENNNISDDALHGLLTVLKQVIGAKAERFQKHVRTLKKRGGGNAGNTFHEITQPTQQIKLLAQAIQAFFETIDKENVNIKLGVASVRNDAIEDEWFYFAPPTYTPRTQPSELRDPTSTLSTCARKKTIVIIEDIKKEIKKTSKSRIFFATINDTEIDEGSIICYPILDEGGKVIYIISVSANKKDYFQHKKKAIYLNFFEHFALRIRLEHNLLLIKNFSAEPQAMEMS